MQRMLILHESPHLQMAHFVVIVHSMTHLHSGLSLSLGFRNAFIRKHQQRYLQHVHQKKNSEVY